MGTYFQYFSPHLHLLHLHVLEDASAPSQRRRIRVRPHDVQSRRSCYPVAHILPRLLSFLFIFFYFYFFTLIFSTSIFSYCIFLFFLFLVIFIFAVLDPSINRPGIRPSLASLHGNQRKRAKTAYLA